AQGRFSITENIPGKAYARPQLGMLRVEILAFRIQIDTRVWRTAVRGRIEQANLCARIARAGNRIDGIGVRNRTAPSGRHGDPATREEELPGLGLVVRSGIEKAECRTRRFDLRNDLEPHAVGQSQPPCRSPRILRKPLILIPASVVDLLHIVLPISLNTPQKQIRKRISRVERVAQVAAEEVRALGVVDRVDAHVTRAVLEVEAGLELVASLDPRNIVGEVGIVIGPVEWPTVVESERRCRAGYSISGTLRLG